MRDVTAHAACDDAGTQRNGPSPALHAAPEREAPAAGRNVPSGIPPRRSRCAMHRCHTAFPEPRPSRLPMTGREPMACACHWCWSRTDQLWHPARRECFRYRHRPAWKPLTLLTLSGIAFDTCTRESAAHKPPGFIVRGFPPPYVRSPTTCGLELSRAGSASCEGCKGCEDSPVRAPLCGFPCADSP